MIPLLNRNEWFEGCDIEYIEIAEIEVYNVCWCDDWMFTTWRSFELNVKEGEPLWRWRPSEYFWMHAGYAPSDLPPEIPPYSQVEALILQAWEFDLWDELIRGYDPVGLMNSR